MEFTFLIPFVIFTALGAGGYFLGRSLAKKHGKRLAQIEATPRAKGREVAHYAQRTAKMVGKVMAPAGTLTSPIAQKECVYYRFIVEEEQTRTSTDSKGRTRTSKVWVAFIDSAKMVAAGIEDADGAIEVSLSEAEMLIKDGAKQQTGMFSDVSARLRKLIEDEYDEKTTGFFTKKKLRIREQVLEVGERALVIGKVKLVRSNLGVRPRFVRGKEPLLVTDKTDAELKDHFKWGVFWSNLGMFGGAGCGSLAALGLVVLALYLGYNRFILGRPLIGGPSFSAPRDAAAEVLAAMKSPDKWARRRSVEPLGKGPEGDLAGKKKEIKAGLMGLLNEQDHDVYGPAADVLPAWAEKEDVPQLIAWLDDKRDPIRRNAAKALGKMQEESALAPMKAAFLKDPEGMGAALKGYGPKVEEFAADHLFHERGDVRAAADKMMEGQPNRDRLAVDRAIAALADPKVRHAASDWLEKATLSEAQQAKAAAAMVKAIESKVGDVPGSMALALGRMATKEEVPGLVAAMKHPSEALRHHAMLALARLGDERGLPAMAESFPRDPDGTLKALAPYGEKAEPVIASFLFDPNDGVRAKAAEALKASKNRDRLFVEGAKAALAGRDAGRQVRAMDWLEKEKAGVTAEDRKALAPSLALLVAGKDRGVAEKAVKLLEPDVTKEQVPDLIVALKAHAGDVRKSVLGMLQKLGDDSALPALGDVFPSAAADVMPVLKSFGEKGEPYLAKHLFRGAIPVRGKAAEGLADSPRKDAMYFKAALEALEGTVTVPKELAMAWLEKAKLSEEQVKAAGPVLLKATEIDDPKQKKVTEGAMRVLASNATPALLDTFVSGSRSKNTPIRHASINGLVKIGDEKAAAAVCEVLGADAKAATAALKKMVKARAEAALRDYLKNKKFGTGRAGNDAIRVLGDVGTPDSIPVLEEFAKEKDFDRAAKGAIGAIKKRAK